MPSMAKPITPPKTIFPNIQGLTPVPTLVTPVFLSVLHLIFILLNDLWTLTEPGELTNQVPELLMSVHLEGGVVVTEIFWFCPEIIDAQLIKNKSGIIVITFIADLYLLVYN